MPDPDPAPEARRHPPPRGVPHAMLALLSIAPALDLLSIAAASPMLAGLAALLARVTLVAGIGPALALMASLATADRTPPAGPADRRARRGRTPGA